MSHTLVSNDAPKKQTIYDPPPLKKKYKENNTNVKL